MYGSTVEVYNASYKLKDTSILNVAVGKYMHMTYYTIFYSVVNIIVYFLFSVTMQ